MVILLDFQSDRPIYVQLKEKIIEGIASGRLKPGDPLPSVRSLAKDIGINMHTVNKAYQLLKQDGFIQIHRQKGVVVNPDGMPPADEVYISQLEENLRPLISESICRGMSEADFLSHCRRLFQDIQK